jgi:hypothetical protein
MAPHRVDEPSAFLLNHPLPSTLQLKRSKKSLEIYQHLSLGAVEQAYQEAVQGGSI